MSKEELTDGYEVGYGKPPKKSQFQKGVSGNPTGRPKKARDLGAALLREANSLITINDNGRKIRLSKHEVAIKMMINNAMKGKPSDQRLYFAQYLQAFDKVALVTAQQNSENEGLKDANRLTDAELEKIILDGIENEEMLQRSQIEPAKGTEHQPFLRKVALWIVARRDGEKKDGILQKLQEQARAGFSQNPAIPDELLVTLAALDATSVIASDAALWRNSKADFGVSDDSVNDKINEALKATAKRTPSAPESTQDQLRASLAEYYNAFCKLNGQAK